MRFLFVLFLLYPVCGFSQRLESFNFSNVKVHLSPDFSRKSIIISADYHFTVRNDIDSIVFDSKIPSFFQVRVNVRKVDYSQSKDKLKINYSFETGVNYTLSFSYEVLPGRTVYFIDSDKGSINNEQIWTQGQGKYTSYWLPSFDDMNKKLEFDFSATLYNGMAFVSNGRLEGRYKDPDGAVTWVYDMTQPMSSYLAAFVIGNFDKKVLQSKSGVPIELYYEPKDSLKVEPTYRYTKEIFDFFEEEIGVAYPWQNYKQVPVHDFLYAGMENTTCTIFSNQYVIDSTAFVDKNYVNVNAHELAHQWFGNLVTEESGEHHWLHEGFATYYAYLVEKELFGEDHFYWKLYQTGKTLHKLSENEGGEALTDPKASSLTFYEKGAWALVALRERVGDKAFKKGIKAYLNTYAFDNATITDFLMVMEKASKTDLAPFKETWLVNTEFPWKEVKTLLSTKNASLKSFFALQGKIADSTLIDEEKLMQFWNGDTPISFKRQFVFDYYAQIPDSTLVMLLEKEPLEVRQSVALAITEISEELRPAFELLLDDESYATKENVLFKLWRSFPERQVEYLDKLNGVVGLPNKNVRLLWLTLALITENYQTENKKLFYEELNGYTAPLYNFEVRQLAFRYLYQIGALSDESLKNMLQACNHHVWQFKKSSRNLLRELYETEVGKRRLNDIKPLLSEELLNVWETVLIPK